MLDPLVLVPPGLRASTATLPTSWWWCSQNGLAGSDAGCPQGPFYASNFIPFVLCGVGKSDQASQNLWRKAALLTSTVALPEERLLLLDMPTSLPKHFSFHYHHFIVWFSYKRQQNLPKAKEGNKNFVINLTLQLRYSDTARMGRGG